jgi:hypothetical protein
MEDSVWRPDRRNVRALDRWSRDNGEEPPVWAVIVWRTQTRGEELIGPFKSWDDANGFVLDHYLCGKALIRQLHRPDRFEK